MLRQSIIVMKRFLSILSRIDKPENGGNSNNVYTLYAIPYLIFYFREPKGTFGRTIDAIFSKISFYEGK